VHKIIRHQYNSSNIRTTNDLSTARCFKEKRLFKNNLTSFCKTSYLGNSWNLTWLGAVVKMTGLNFHYHTISPSLLSKISVGLGVKISPSKFSRNKNVHFLLCAGSGMPVCQQNLRFRMIFDLCDIHLVSRIGTHGTMENSVVVFIFPTDTRNQDL
jgi:hypothetical protein